MISPKYPLKNKLSLEDPLKLPQIPSRKQIHSIKKNSSPTSELPHIKNKAIKQNLSINKENNSLNLVQRKNSLDNQVKARLFEVQAVDKMVKNVLGGPEATVQLGGDMTNFQLKIQVNRQILRKQRNKSHFTQKNQNLPQQKADDNKNQIKHKCVSSKQVKSISAKPMSIRQDLKLKITQNNQNDNLLKQDEQNIQNIERNKAKFKSQSRQKNSPIHKNQDNSKIFKSIKDILSDPQKVSLQLEAKKVTKMVKFTIEELQSRLKQMKNLEFNKSHVDANVENKKNQKSVFDRTLTSAKSVGMIPIAESPISQDYTFKNWNRVQFSQPQQQGSDEKYIRSNKIVKYHKSDFDHEMDQIQKLEMKSYKSIQRMVENRKLLIDLNLLNAKHKNNILAQNPKQIKINQGSV